MKLFIVYIYDTYDKQLNTKIIAETSISDAEKAAEKICKDLYPDNDQISFFVDPLFEIDGFEIALIKQLD